MIWILTMLCGFLGSMSTRVLLDYGVSYFFVVWVVLLIVMTAVFATEERRRVAKNKELEKVLKQAEAIRAQYLELIATHQSGGGA